MPSTRDDEKKVFILPSKKKCSISPPRPPPAQADEEGRPGRSGPRRQRGGADPGRAEAGLPALRRRRRPHRRPRVRPQREQRRRRRAGTGIQNNATFVNPLVNAVLYFHSVNSGRRGLPARGEEREAGRDVGGGPGELLHKLFKYI